MNIDSVEINISVIMMRWCYLLSHVFQDYSIHRQKQWICFCCLCSIHLRQYLKLNVNLVQIYSLLFRQEFTTGCCNIASYKKCIPRILITKLFWQKHEGRGSHISIRISNFQCYRSKKSSFQPAPCQSKLDQTEVDSVAGILTAQLFRLLTQQTSIKFTSWPVTHTLATKFI